MSGHRKKRHTAGGQPQEVTAHRTRWSRPRRAALVLAVAVGGLLISALLIYPAASRGLERATGGSAEPKLTAVIVDQLSLTAPNPAFAESTTEMLEEAGYSVAYYPARRSR